MIRRYLIFFAVIYAVVLGLYFTQEIDLAAWVNQTFDAEMMPLPR